MDLLRQEAMGGLNLEKNNSKRPLEQIWTRANVGEVLPNVVTPLTWSVIRATLTVDNSRKMDPEQFWLASEGSEAVEAAGESAGLPAAHHTLSRQDGRVYLRMDALLDTFCYLPGVTPGVMGKVLGVGIPPEAAGYTPPRGLRVRLAQAVFRLEALGLLPRLATTAQFILRRLPQPPGSGPGQELALLRWTAKCFRLHLKATAAAVGAYAWLERLLPAEERELLPQILLGREDLQTARQGRSLWRLAEVVLADQELLEVFGEFRQGAPLDWSQVRQRLEGFPSGRQFLQDFQAFLNENGARAAGEFELALPRWREDPGFVLEVLQKNLAAAQDGPSLAFSTGRRQEAAAEAVAAIRAGKSPLQRLFFDRLLHAYGGFSTLRENLKYSLMEGYALLREVILEKAERLVAAGLLATRQDIFFLTPAEILNLEERVGRPEQIAAWIGRRKEQHARWEALPAAQDGPAAAQPGALAGIGSSPGVIAGVARVLMDPSQAGELQPGEILVAPHTDPGWTPLFLSCAAVVTETGGFLSHGATVAREYGIPCVVSVHGATSLIHTGDWIHVDGTHGRVALQ